MCKRIAIVDWNHIIEDYLNNINLTIDDFLSMSGGWLFNYIIAIKQLGHEPIFYCFSDKITKVETRIHKTLFFSITLLPAPQIYRKLRTRILNPYATSASQSSTSSSFLSKFINKMLFHFAPYLATPYSLLVNTFQKDQIDVILCQEYEHARYDLCAYFGYKSKTPVIGIYQGGNWQISKFEKYIRPRTLAWAESLVIGSSLERNRIKHEYKNLKTSIFPIRNPVENISEDNFSKKHYREALQIPLNSSIVLWYGRIDYQRKGLDRLIASWQCIKSKDAVLYIIGDGSGRSLLKQQLEKVANNKIIWIKEYMTNREKLFSYVKAADLFVFLSRNEGFPVAPLEAMAHGLPVIATSSPGMEEILLPENESGGILLNNNATADDIAGTIDIVLNELKTSNSRSVRAKAWVLNYFSINRLSMELKEIFDCNSINFIN